MLLIERQVLLDIILTYYLTVLSIIVFTALPEGWFFRGYFMQRLELFKLSVIAANVIFSGFFALLHIPAQGIIGLLTFSLHYSLAIYFNEREIYYCWYVCIVWQIYSLLFTLMTVTLGCIRRSYITYYYYLSCAERNQWLIYQNFIFRIVCHWFENVAICS